MLFLAHLTESQSDFFCSAFVSFDTSGLKENNLTCLTIDDAQIYSVDFDVADLVEKRLDICVQIISKVDTFVVIVGSVYAPFWAIF